MAPDPERAKTSEEQLEKSDITLKAQEASVGNQLPVLSETDSSGGRPAQEKSSPEGGYAAKVAHSTIDLSGGVSFSSILQTLIRLPLPTKIGSLAFITALPLFLSGNDRLVVIGVPIASLLYASWLWRITTITFKLGGKNIRQTVQKTLPLALLANTLIFNGLVLAIGALVISWLFAGVKYFCEHASKDVSLMVASGFAGFAGVFVIGILIVLAFASPILFARHFQWLSSRVPTTNELEAPLPGKLIGSITGGIIGAAGTWFALAVGAKSATFSSEVQIQAIFQIFWCLAMLVSIIYLEFVAHRSSKLPK